MEQQEHEHEHEVYGGEIPDEGEMDADAEDVDMVSRPEDDSDPNSKNIEDMRKRLKEIEEEAGALREMQAKVEKEMGAVQDSSSASATQAEKEEVDSRSIYVGNMPIVDSLRLKGDAQLFLLGGSLVLFEERVSHLGNKLYEGEDCNWTSGG
ncbi:unnamed protein product, partial [Vitis vinifera]